MLAGGRRASCKRTGYDAAQSAAAPAARTRAAVDAFLAGAESRAAAVASSKPRLEAIDEATGRRPMMIAGMRVGLISDTHGLLRPQALLALDGVDLILHAGDVGGLSIVRELEAFAPVHAVHGNTDDPALGLPAQVSLTLEGLRVTVTHGHELGSPAPMTLASRYGADVIVFGHTHKPLVERVMHSLVVNPGAAGPRRFNVRPSIGLLHIELGRATAEILTLDV
jgi:uncharacterized protein